jgi:hypothetical protein
MFVLSKYLTFDTPSSEKHFIETVVIYKNYNTRIIKKQILQKCIPYLIEFANGKKL